MIPDRATLMCIIGLVLCGIAAAVVLWDVGKWYVEHY